MAHRTCVRKMRKHIWCDCINDDLEELKRIRKLLSKYVVKNACLQLSKDNDALNALAKAYLDGEE